MALLFLDGFDHYATAEIAQKWTSSSNAAISATEGRNSSQGLHLDATGSNGSITRTLSPGSSAAGGIGFAIRVTGALFNSTSGNELIQVQQADATQHVALGLTAAGLFTAKRGTTALGTSSSGISLGSWFYLEFKWDIHDTTGSLSVKLNGTTVLSLTGQDTRNAGDGTWARIVLQNGSNATGTEVYVDDLAIWDTSGSANTDFLGPIRVKAIYPDGAGASTDFTPSAGSNFQNVDEALTDGDTTYNSEGTAGDHDTYTFGAVGLSGTVRGVQTNLMVRSDGAGAETIRPKIRIGAVDYNGTTVGITTSYADSREVFQVSPATSTAWTVAEIDGAEFGIELVS